MTETLERPEACAPALLRPPVTAPPPPRTRLGKAVETLATTLLAALLAVSVGGTYAGVIYWLAQGWTWGAVLSALLPGFGAVSAAWSLAG